ncbi:MAG: NAD-dependent epimerase/dehydratase family protein [Nanoarchaeota archaeon]
MDKKERPSKKIWQGGKAGKADAFGAQKTNVLVTGATGFLGRRLVPALLQCGYGVTCLVRGDPGPGLWADCRMIEGDLRDEKSIAAALEGTHAVVHAGAVINPKDPSLFETVNVKGTKSLAEASKKARVHHFIFISSVDVGHGTKYGNSKETGEEIVKTSGVPFTIFRPGPIYGVGDDKNIMELFNLVKTKKVMPVIGSGNNLRQPIHVDDVVLAIIRVICSGKAIGKTYYLGGPSITHNEILAAMIEASDNRPTIVHLPSGLAKTLVMAVNKFGLGPNISRDQVRTLDSDKTGDLGPFEEDFKFKARPFKEGFNQVLDELEGRETGKTPSLALDSDGQGNENTQKGKPTPPPKDKRAAKAMNRKPKKTANKKVPAR